MAMFSSPPSGNQIANLRRLVMVRWGALAFLTLLTLALPDLLDIPLVRLPVLAVLAAAALVNGLMHWRSSGTYSAGAPEMFMQLLTDILVLATVVFFSGGAANPLVSLLLLPVAVAALTLPLGAMLAIGAGALGAYSLLMVFYLPLPLADPVRATRLHLLGMWLTFAVSAAMISWFVRYMTQLVRERDAALAAAREQALRDERVMAIGTLAAGAAHELGTPLATMALLAGELVHDAALPAEARADIELLRQQIAQCKQIITGLSRQAGAARLENVGRQAADHWLETIRQRWHALRPEASSTMRVSGHGKPPELVVDPRLEQALLNLLNNAAAASQECVSIELDWTTAAIHIDVRDQGPGFPAEILALGGHSPQTPHEKGFGIGLMLARSAIEQLGGRLTLSNPPPGGALARIELPRITP